MNNAATIPPWVLPVAILVLILGTVIAWKISKILMKLAFFAATFLVIAGIIGWFYWKSRNP